MNIYHLIYVFPIVLLLLLIYKYGKYLFCKSKMQEEKFLRIIGKQDIRIRKMRLEQVVKILEAEMESPSAAQKNYKEIARQLHIAIFE